MTPSTRLSLLWLFFITGLCLTTLWSLKSKPFEMTAVFPNTESLSGSILTPNSVTETEPIRIEWSKLLDAQAPTSVEVQGQKSSITILGSSLLVTPQTEWEWDTVTITVSGSLASVWGDTIGTGFTLQFVVRGKALIDQTFPAEWDAIENGLVFLHSKKQDLQSVFEEIQHKPNIITLSPNTLTGSWQLVDPWTLVWKSTGVIEPNDTIKLTVSGGTTIRNQEFRFRSAGPELKFGQAQETSWKLTPPTEPVWYDFYGNLQFEASWPMKQKISFAEILRCPQRKEKHPLEAITAVTRDNDPLAVTDCTPVQSTLIIDQKNVTLTARTDGRAYHIIHFQLGWFDRSGASQTAEYWYGGQILSETPTKITDCTGRFCHGQKVSLRNIEKDGTNITFSVENNMWQINTGSVTIREYTTLGLPAESITRETAVAEKRITPKNGLYTITWVQTPSTLVIHTDDRNDFFVLTLDKNGTTPVIVQSGSTIRITPPADMSGANMVTLTGPNNDLWSGSLSHGVTLQLVSGATIDTTEITQEWTTGAAIASGTTIHTEFAEGLWNIQVQNETQTRFYTATFSGGNVTQIIRPVWSDEDKDPKKVQVFVPPFLRPTDTARGFMTVQTKNDPIQIEFTGEKDDQWVIAPNQTQTVSFDLSGSTDPQTWWLTTTEGVGDSQSRNITIQNEKLLEPSSGNTLLIQRYDPSTGQELSKLTRNTTAHMRATSLSWDPQTKMTDVPKLPGAEYGFGAQATQTVSIPWTTHGKRSDAFAIVRPLFSGVFHLSSHNSVTVWEAQE